MFIDWGKIYRFWRTVKYLKADQIFHQCKYRLFSPSINLPNTHRVPQVCDLSFKAAIQPPIPQDNFATVKDGVFSFIGMEVELGFPPDWQASAMSKLYQYNLHYLDALYYLPFEDAKALTEHWINKNPFREDNVGWEPYPISLRLLNSCLNFYEVHKDETKKCVEFSQELSRSLEQQADALSERIEYHLYGNHLLENAVALLIYGRFFDGEIAKKCRERGLKILQKQLPEQFDNDGLHFEKSPMYHSRILWLLLTLYNFSSHDFCSFLRPYIEDALQVFVFLCHPDREIALLKDSAFKINLAPQDLFAYAESLGFQKPKAQGNFGLRESGYFGRLSNEGNYLICDTGAVGPDYIPGHAHGDMLSYELSFSNERIVVDSGVFDYVPTNMRGYCRSTAAHNTVVIDETDQCEFWSTFRMARRVEGHLDHYSETEKGFSLRAHVGNYKTREKVCHHREIDWGGEQLIVRDSLVGKFGKAESFLHLHPDCQLESQEDGMWKFSKNGVQFALIFSGAEASLVDGWYCPQFSRRYKNMVVCWSLHSAEDTLEYKLVNLSASGCKSI